MIALISRKESIKKWVPYFGLNSRVNDPAFLFLELASGFPVSRAELAPGFLSSPSSKHERNMDGFAPTS